LIPKVLDELGDRVVEERIVDERIVEGTGRAVVTGRVVADVGTEQPQLRIENVAL
jgi:hypothetical protein